jgi:hypothetical protein
MSITFYIRKHQQDEHFPNFINSQYTNVTLHTQFNPMNPMTAEQMHYISVNFLSNNTEITDMITHLRGMHPRGSSACVS